MILVADQNRATAEMMVRRLALDGLPAEVVPNAGLAPGRAVAGDVRMLVIDPGMPGAWEAIGQLREEPRTRSVLVTFFGTAQGPELKEAGQAAGVTTFLVKGRTTPREFVAEVRRRLERVQAAPRELASQGVSYELHLVGGTADACRLAADVGASPGLQCPRCAGDLTLRVHRDAAKSPRWMSSALVCRVCAKRPPHRRAPTQHDIAMMLERNMR